jgi:phage terminase small subunit
MPRARSPNRDKAYEIYKKHDGNITNRQIAEILGEDEKKVAVWKQRDKWNVVQQTESNVVQQKKRGAPKGNKNAEGNSGGHPSSGNKNAEKHGFFAKIFPDDEATQEIIESIEIKSPLEMLWENIIIQYTAIARAQRLMFVKDQNDLTKVLKREKESSGMSSDSWEKEYELQFAWDKHANFLKAQSTAMKALEGLIARYEELSGDKQKLEIEKMKAEIAKIKAGGDGGDDDVTIIDDIGGTDGRS